MRTPVTSLRSDSSLGKSPSTDYFNWLVPENVDIKFFATSKP
jgi:hypothetical protein